MPGAGGTQRLPRLAGLEAALRMITTGEFVPAPAAARLGIIDQVVDGDLRAGAIAFAECMAAGKGPHPRVRDRTVDAAAGVFDRARQEAARAARGQFAPARCVDAVEMATRIPFDEALVRERAMFVECLASPQAKGLMHAFFAEREAAQIPDVPASTPTKTIAAAAVIGGGTMGGGIAMNFANAGIPVRILETSREALDRGLATIRKNYATTVSRGRLAQEEMDRRVGLISGTLDYADIRDADMVIEAVFEEMDIKRDVFRKIDSVMKPGAVLATNTSTLDVDAIAAVTRRPGDVIGTHFFSPANVMKLLEIVRGRATSQATIATAMKLGKTIGKVPVLVGVCDGFVGNRMLHPYIREAEFLLAEGATPQQVDKALYDFGLAMGPFAMLDLSGLDVGWRIRKRHAATRPKHLRYSGIADRICEMGRFGQKTGAGWYRYEAGNRTPIADPEIERMIAEEAKTAGVARRAISDDEIVKRCMYSLVNEGALILEEGIALRAGDIDVIYIYGYGFPAWRGGPMFWADTVGLANVYADMRRFEAQHGEFWAPAPLLAKLAAAGSSFADLKAKA
jgi:3-hydroxyacyl-CoA dehydrogenase